ncbi:hypothetical protein F4782DRAFT_524587 [Xylaria castorea]|nr:hypothetical protein F4782DRAFT_524587 [Xylaria castorea]
MPADLSAWILTTAEEGDVELQSRLCFPRRICIAVDQPAGSIAESQLRIAGCAVDIAGKLYVLTAGTEPSANSDDGIRQEGVTWDSSRRSSSEIRLNIKKSVRLGHVLSHPRVNRFILIEVADTFRACQDQGCSECLTPVNSYWATTRLGPLDYGSVHTTALNKGDRTTVVQDALLIHFIHLQYLALNRDCETFEDYSLHDGLLTESGLSERLRLTDSGSLVSSEGQDIGISVRMMPDFGRAMVLLFDDKLWAYLINLLRVSDGMEETQSEIKAPNTWKHLEAGAGVDFTCL